MEELKKYVQKTSKDKLILGLFAVVFAAAACVLLTRHNWILFIVMLLCAVALFIGAITSSADDKKFFSFIENSPERDKILADFASAKSYANDSIRLGENYIFSKKMTRLLGYESIQKLQYFEHHDLETQRTEPGIAMVLTNGKSRTLCNLNGGDPQMQAQEIFEIILSKNPNVEIEA